MKCAEIADEVIATIEAGAYDLIKLNYPNGDMVGHTGVYQAVLASLEVMDLQIGRMMKAVAKAGGVLLLTADHGNSDDMYERKKGQIVRKADGKPKAKTAHSLNPVPFLVYDPAYSGEYSIKLREGLGISSVAATCIHFLGFEAPDDYDPGIVSFG